TTVANSGSGGGTSIRGTAARSPARAHRAGGDALAMLQPAANTASAHPTAATTLVVAPRPFAGAGAGARSPAAGLRNPSARSSISRALPWSGRLGPASFIAHRASGLFRVPRPAPLIPPASRFPLFRDGPDERQRHVVLINTSQPSLIVESKPSARLS